jgi:putative peptide zinc metalloprotease protein
VRHTEDPDTPLELVLPDHSRLALLDELTIGRAPSSTLRLTDPTVSRSHARITLGDGGGATLEDEGSSFGTWLDGRRLRGRARLRPGARIEVGDLELVVDRRRTEQDSAPTIVVPPNASLTIPVGGPPRIRSGHALKRLEAAEGDRRWVLKDLRSGRYVRLSDGDAELFALIDGQRPLAELMREAGGLLGPQGSARLMLLLAALGEHGFLSGTPAAPTQEDGAEPDGRLRRLVKPHDRPWPGAAAWFDRIYRGGGRALLTRPALAALGALAVAGLGVFAYLVAARYGTPFVVASKLGIGGIVFIAGRFAVAAVHESAHGLVMASFGRGVREAGFKRVLIFPYVYVDTSDAWFEPRRRRIAVSAAGPVSDLCLGGLFSLCCLALAAGTVRDVFFQLALGAYIAAFFNLNPLVERDGYHILVDLLREPGLRRRAREQLRARLAGESGAPESAVLRRYSLAGLAWSVLGAALAVGLSLRYLPAFETLAPPPVVWTFMGAIWLTLFAPVVAMIGLPLLARRRARAA